MSASIDLGIAVNSHTSAVLASVGMPVATQSAGLDAAIERANRWVEAARPIIRAMFAIEDIDLSGVEGKYTRREACGYLGAAYLGLESMLDGIRDEFLCDERKSWNPLMTTAEAMAADQFNDDLDEQVTSIKDAVSAQVLAERAKGGAE